MKYIVLQCITQYIFIDKKIRASLSSFNFVLNFIKVPSTFFKTFTKEMLDSTTDFTIKNYLHIICHFVNMSLISSLETYKTHSKLSSTKDMVSWLAIYWMYEIEIFSLLLDSWQAQNTICIPCWNRFQNNRSSANKKWITEQCLSLEKMERRKVIVNIFKITWHFKLQCATRKSSRQMMCEKEFFPSI